MSNLNSNTIIIIGFQHVGKSTLGCALAQALGYPFFDLDQEIEKKFKAEHQQALSSRAILQQEGEIFFRALEHHVLAQLLEQAIPSVIALGGGTPIQEKNRLLLQSATLIHVMGIKEEVFERVIQHGRPAFIPKHQEINQALNELWDLRMPIYTRLAHCSVLHEGQVEITVMKIIKKLQSKKILLLHGPNLNQLGKRDNLHYGHCTLSDIESLTRQKAQEYTQDVICFQSNHEGVLIDILQSKAGDCLGVIINPGAFAHYSYALHDALLDTQLPIVEVHLSKIEEREIWRRHSVITPVCIHQVQGKKEQGYVEAVTVLMEFIKHAD